MDKQKYSNYPLTISQILGLIKANDIAIPEIQRSFVGCINDGGWHFADGHGCGAGPVMGYGPVVTRDRVETHGRASLRYQRSNDTMENGKIHGCQQFSHHQCRSMFCF